MPSAERGDFAPVFVVVGGSLDSWVVAAGDREDKQARNHFWALLQEVASRASGDRNRTDPKVSSRASDWSPQDSRRSRPDHPHRCRSRAGRRRPGRDPRPGPHPSPRPRQHCMTGYEPTWHACPPRQACQCSTPDCLDGRARTPRATTRRAPPEPCTQSRTAARPLYSPCAYSRQGGDSGSPRKHHSLRGSQTLE